MKQHTNSTRPGINPLVRIENLGKEEKQIITNLSHKYWYITRVEKRSYGQSTYNVAYIKPVDYVTQNFSISREILLIMSTYDRFEPRTLDVLDDTDLQQLRIEEICCFVASKDPNIEDAITTVQKSNKESRIFIPFTYNSLLTEDNDEYVINQMRLYFYSRDLFGIQDALQKDLYFFGRSEIIQELVNRHSNYENSGIFGLRKTGKTSILFGIQRTLIKKENVSVLIDCQILHLQPWNYALHTIIKKLVDENSLKQKLANNNKDRYADECQAAAAFAEDIQTVLQELKRDILLIFDEVENITYGTSASESWNNGSSFIKFWQVIRSIFQGQIGKYRYTYLIAGTNPRCVELPKINNVDNPIFAQFTPFYIQPFDFNKTKEMLDQLGGYMGMNFTPEVVTHIEEDFGGHPLLIRQICSYIHKRSSSIRPIRISKHEYLEFKQKFYEDQAGFAQYARMILQVLEDWYPDEYQMLQWLAVDDYDSFIDFASDNDFINHLKSYGIIYKDNSIGQYHFKIEALKGFLASRNKFQHPAKTTEEKVNEIFQRRDSIERKLRRLVKRQLKSSLGETKAKEEMIRVIYEPKEIGHKSNIPYADFFDPSKHEIYLDGLFSVIKRNYCHFENLINLPLHEFEPKATLMNQYRRVDAHAKDINESDFQTFRGLASWFEDLLEDE